MAVHAEWLWPEWPAGRALGTAWGVGAVMTTRAGGASAAPFDTFNLRDGLGDTAAAVAANHAALALAVGRTPVFLNQVHGTRVVRLTQADAMPGALVHQADASVTTAPGLACAVQVADCLPVLFAAPGVGGVGGVGSVGSVGSVGRVAGVGAAHAGWRGLAAGVLEATVHALCEAAGCAPHELHAWLGACIGPQRFEVGADVRDAFGAAGTARFVQHAAGKWLADLPGLARDRLQAAGVRAVSGGGWCTASDASRFFSYRRDGVTGRMAALVWIDR